MNQGFYPEDFTVTTRDFRNFKMFLPNYYITKSGERIDLNVGEESDLASTPKPTWGLTPPTGWYARAAWLHDKAYRYTLKTKAECDALLLEAMDFLLTKLKEGKIDTLELEAEARIFYEAVKLCGESSFEADRKAQGGLNA